MKKRNECAREAGMSDARNMAMHHRQAAGSAAATVTETHGHVRVCRIAGFHSKHITKGRV